MFKKPFLLGVLLYTLSLSAQASILINVNTDKAQFNAGDTVSLAINISGLDANVALGSYALLVGFDPGILRFNSTVFGDPLLGDQLDIQTPGSSFPSASDGDASVFLSEFSLDDSSFLLVNQANNFTLASIFFTALSSGTSTAFWLDSEFSSLSNSEGNALSYSSGTISAVPLPATLWLFISGLAFTMRKRPKLHA